MDKEDNLFDIKSIAMKSWHSFKLKTISGTKYYTSEKQKKTTKKGNYYWVIISVIKGYIGVSF